MKTLTAKPENNTKSRSPFISAKGTAGFFAVQAKLNIGKPNDKFENEADHVADVITERNQTKNQTAVSPVNSPTVQRLSEEKLQEKPLAETITPFVQRKAEDEEEVQQKIENQGEHIQKQEEEEDLQPKLEEEETLQTRSEEKEELIQAQPEEEEQVQAQVEEEEENVQAQPENATLSVPPVETKLKQNIGNGSPLPGDLQTNLENNLGVDLSGVKIHTGSAAVQMNKELRAQAFTNKSDIYFNEGKFNPSTSKGQHLLAHEITHTVQQGAVKPLSEPKQKEKKETSDSELPVIAQQNTVSSQNAAQDTIPKGSAKQANSQQKVSDSKENGLTQIENKRQGEMVTEVSQPVVEKPEDKKDEAAFPTSPAGDPNFKAVEQKVKQVAAGQQSHNPALAESETAQNAAVSPANERESQAQASQVETMDEQEPGEFDAAAFKAKLMERISNMQLPDNQEEAADFENNNNIDEVSQAAEQDVQGEQTAAAGDIEQATAQAPNPENVPEREVQELPPAQIGDAPQPVGAQTAMPHERPDNQVSQPLQENMQEVDQTMAENEITDEQLANSNEPSFTSALGAKQEAQANTENAPGQFREQEQQTLTSTQQEAETGSQAQLQGMYGTREAVMTQMVGQQQQTGTQDTEERTRIANEINIIYENTKTEVEGILTALDESVSTMFTSATKRAKSKFESHVQQKMDAYKSRRYSGLRGAARWVRDKFMGIPEEVNVFFSEGRQKYIDEMDAALTAISQHVAEKLTEAKNRIATGKQEVADYVSNLPESLQEIGREAAENIQNQFDELESSVDSKQDELIDSLAQQYVQSLQEVDASIDEMKAANRGLVDMALDAVKGVIETIINIKNTLTNLLISAISVIKTIISDPIGFLGNLISGISQGFKNFGSNILKHLTSGLVGWLTGSLGSMGITIPEDLFSLKGIFSLVMQVLGLTWDYMRKKAVKLLGEPVVAALETGFEIFQIIRKEGIAGLWNFIKEQFNDLKETVIGAIKEMVITKVIEAGIKWVLGLMNPVGAFIKAAMMIIDIVKFFIERGRQILALVEAFIDGVKAVASGSVAKVAEAIENALARAIPVIIGFLASLLGISGLAGKVQALIQRIRKRIDKAIDSVILKAQKWFRKAGSKIKGAAAKFFMFWKNKKSFKDKQGKTHKLYFNGEGSSAILTVASTPTPLTVFLTNVDAAGNAEKQAAKTQAVTLSQQVDNLKSTPVTGSNETEKSRKSKEVDDAVKVKMDSLVPLINKLMGGEEKSVDLLKVYLNKKVTNEDGSVKQNFINDFDTDKNKTESKKVYVLQQDKKITRGPNRAEQGFMSIQINDNDGILLPGPEKKYTPAHKLFKPEDIVITRNNGIFTATYETNQSTGGGKQKYTVDVNFEQIENGIPNQVEQRNVKGENMVKKPDGMVRGSTDSAGGGFDNAHLIGDRFGGSGYNQGLNIYPSSESYNRVTMLSKENSLFNGLNSGSTFEMTVNARINHETGKKGANVENHLNTLLNTEFKKDNSGKSQDKPVQDGFVKKMRSEIAKDIKGIPGKFESVAYSAKQEGRSLSYNIGEDTDYEKAVKQKLGA